MKTNSPNPFVSDVQALIADCEREIASLTDQIERMKRHHTPFDLSRYESQLKRQQMALAGLEAELSQKDNENNEKRMREEGQSALFNNYLILLGLFLLSVGFWGFGAVKGAYDSGTIVGFMEVVGFFVCISLFISGIYVIYRVYRRIVK